MFNKRTPIAVVGALAFATSLASCGSSDGDQGNQGATNTANVNTVTPGTLTIGTDLTYPPYDTLEDGQPAGFDIDFMNDVAQRMGLKTKFEDTRFSQIIAGIKSNRYDAIASSLYISPDRAKEVDFVPYFQTGNSIISKAGGDQFTEPSELCGKTVSVVTATVVADNLNTAETDKCKAEGKLGITVKEFPTDPEATQALMAGQVDAQMTDGAVAKSAVDKSRDRIKITSKDLIYPVAVGIGVRKGSSDLVDAITEAIADMKADGSYDKKMEQYNLESVDDKILQQSFGSE